jgi:VanZ family protein
VTRGVFLKFWLPVLLWMAAIFTASTDLGSTQHTSRIIGPFLRFFWSTVPDRIVDEVQTIARKAGHMSGYAGLAILIWRARQRGVFTQPWTMRSALIVEAICLLYAMSDEFHQSFVPTREASVRDVLIDGCGAALALFAIWLIGRRRRRW